MADAVVSSLTSQRQDPKGARRGVPQYFQFHQCLLAGKYGLENLFPGYFEELQRRGARHVDWVDGYEMVSGANNILM